MINKTRLLLSVQTIGPFDFDYSWSANNITSLYWPNMVKTEVIGKDTEEEPTKMKSGRDSGGKRIYLI